LRPAQNSNVGQQVAQVVIAQHARTLDLRLKTRHGRAAPPIADCGDDEFIRRGMLKRGVGDFRRDPTAARRTVTTGTIRREKCNPSLWVSARWD
jgi:hypothetical protein